MSQPKQQYSTNESKETKESKQTQPTSILASSLLTDTQDDFVMLYKYRNLYDLLREGANRVKNFANEDIVLVIGNTGAGKSTFITYMMEGELKKDNILGSDAYVLQDKKAAKNYPEIGDTLESRTLFPEIFHSAENVRFCDCPGFFDNRNQNERIAISINLEQVLRKARSVKVVVLINQHDLAATKANNFINLSQLLTKIFIDTSKISNSLFWLVTKTTSTQTLEDIKKQLFDQKGGVLAVTMKKLAKIYRDVEAMLKECDLSKIFELGNSIKELYKMFSLGTDHPEEIQAQIAMLKLMESNQQNIMITNYDTATFRREMFAKIRGIKPIASDLIKFNKYESDRIAFERYLCDTAAVAIKLLQERAQCSLAVKASSDLLKDIASNLQEYAKSQSSDSVTMNKNWLAIIDNEITAIKARKIERDAMIVELKQELKAIDRTDEVVIWRSEFFEKRNWWGYTERQFSYNGEPYENYNENTPDGYIHKRKAIPEDGVYEATYYSQRGKDGKAKIELKSAMNQRYDNKLCIKGINVELKRLEHENQNADNRIRELEAKRVKVEKTKDSTTVKNEFIHDRDQKQLELQQQQLKLDAIDAKIKSRAAVFKTIYNFIQEIPTISSKDQSLLGKYQEEYTAYCSQVNSLTNLSTGSISFPTIHSASTSIVFSNNSDCCDSSSTFPRTIATSSSSSIDTVNASTTTTTTTSTGSLLGTSISNAISSSSGSTVMSDSKVTAVNTSFTRGNF